MICKHKNCHKIVGELIYSFEGFDLVLFVLEYKKELEKRTNEFNQKIKALDEEIRNVQVLFLQAYKQ